MRTWVIDTSIVDSRSPIIWGRSRRGTVSLVVGFTLALFYVIAALFGEFGYDLRIYPYSSRADAVRTDERDLPPSSALLRTVFDHSESAEGGTDDGGTGVTPYHLLGTDSDGRDILVRTLAGAWTYLLPGIAMVGLSLVIGIALGSISGYYHDSLAASFAVYLLTLLDSFPRMVFLIGVAFLTDFRMGYFVLALGVLNAAYVGRIVKAKVNALVRNSFVEGAREMGVSDLRIILKHIVWLNCRQALLVQAISGFSSLILMEATLGYINAGLTSSFVSWGQMIREGMGNGFEEKFVQGMYWQSFPPAIAIVVTLLGLNLLGDGLARRYQIRGSEYR